MPSGPGGDLGICFLPLAVPAALRDARFVASVIRWLTPPANFRAPSGRMNFTHVERNLECERVAKRDLS
jgi:hypothetical protein